jgi:hypothetical protein
MHGEFKAPRRRCAELFYLETLLEAAHTAKPSAMLKTGGFAFVPD